jgi:two-component system response regulator YesN
MLRSIRGLLEVCDGETVVSFLETYLPGSTQYDKRYVQSVAYSIVNLLQIVLTEQNLEPSRVIGRLGRLQYKLDKCSRIHDVRRLLHAVMDDSIAYVARTHADARERIVADIKNVIARRYREHVTVSDIAESVSYSASQANVIFKSATGRTIFDHLSAFRIEKAKELLRDPYSRIYLVAEEVGYRNKSHFCLQFKKATGLTPQQYKSRARE